MSYYFNLNKEIRVRFFCLIFLLRGKKQNKVFNSKPLYLDINLSFKTKFSHIKALIPLYRKAVLIVFSKNKTGQYFVHITYIDLHHFYGRLSSHFSGRLSGRFSGHIYYYQLF